MNNCNIWFPTRGRYQCTLYITKGTIWHNITTGLKHCFKLDMLVVTPKDMQLRVCQKKHKLKNKGLNKLMQILTSLLASNNYNALKNIILQRHDVISEYITITRLNLMNSKRGCSFTTKPGYHHSQRLGLFLDCGSHCSVILPFPVYSNTVCLAESAPKQ